MKQLINEIVKANNNDLKRYMRNQGLDAIVITDPNNIAYYTGFKTTGIYYLTVTDEKNLYVPLMEYWKATRKAGSEIKVYPVSKIIFNENDPPHLVDKSFSELLKDLIEKNEKIGLEKHVLSKEELKKTLEKKRILDITDYIISSRRKKRTEEIKIIQEATRITEEALLETINSLEKGKTELDIYLELISNIYKKKGEFLGFDPIVAIDENAANPHALPDGKKFSENRVLLIDVGAGIANYTSDMTRTIVPEKSNYRTYIENLEDAYNSALELCYPGNKTMEIDLAARRRLSIRRLEKYFIHSLGHGVGIEVHEPPTIGPSSKDVLIEGDVITIEPGVYFPDKLGFRIENIIYITDRGPKILNKIPLTIFY